MGKTLNQSQPSKTIAILGQGYVGLPLAMAAVDAGWNVIGIENSNVKFKEIASGVSPVEDVASSLMKAHLASSVYRISNVNVDVSQASIVVICVPTPLDDLRNPDLTILKAAVTGIAPYLAAGTLVISESTSYPGTVRDVVSPLIEKLKSSPLIQIDIAVAPERVNPGDVKYHQKKHTTFSWRTHAIGDTPRRRIL